MVKNSDIFSLESIFFSFASLGEARQGISCSISFSLALVNLKKIPKGFLCQADLPEAQAFDIHKLAEIFMISEHEDLIFAVFQVIPPILEGLNSWS